MFSAPVRVACFHARRRRPTTCRCARCTWVSCRTRCIASRASCCPIPATSCRRASSSTCVLSTNSSRRTPSTRRRYRRSSVDATSVLPELLCSILDVRCSILDARCSMLDARCSILDARCSILDTRVAILVSCTSSNRRLYIGKN